VITVNILYKIFCIKSLLDLNGVSICGKHIQFPMCSLSIVHFVQLKYPECPFTHKTKAFAGVSQMITSIRHAVDY